MTKCKIIGITNNSNIIMAASGAVSTTKGDALSIFNNKYLNSDESNKKLISKVLKSRHETILEHTVFNIALNNISAYLEQYLISYRLASFTIKSRRYVDMNEQGWYEPTCISELPVTDATRIKYNEYIKELFGIYNELLELGVPKEDARFVLPYAFHSNGYMTINGRNLANMVRDMTFSTSSTDEMRKCGLDLLSQLRDKCEPLFDYIYNNNDVKYNDNINENKLGFDDIAGTNRDAVKLLYYPQEESLITKLCKEGRNYKNDDYLESYHYGFLITNISLASLTHLTRHRIQSLYIPSYDVCSYDEHVNPDSIEIHNATDVYNKAFELYRQTREYFNDNKEVQNYIMLTGLTIPVCVDMNARELQHFFGLRLCNRAQWEIRDIAEKMVKSLHDNESIRFLDASGPNCVQYGVCYEARSCGRIEEMKKKYF